MLKYFIKIAASSAESLSSCHIWDEVAVMRDLLEGRLHTSIRRYSVVGVVSARFRRLTHSLRCFSPPSRHYMRVDGSGHQGYLCIATRK